MINVDDGNATDIDGVMHVMDNAFDPAFGEAWTRGQLLASLALPGTRLILASLESQCIGFALTRSVANEVELLMIGVHNNWRRQQIATRLIQNIIEHELDRRNERIFLEVRHQNPAKAFYEAIGFVEIGRRNNYYVGKDKQRYDAITMSMALLADNM